LIKEEWKDRWYKAQREGKIDKGGEEGQKVQSTKEKAEYRED
jgi:hypothetical protein